MAYKLIRTAVVMMFFLAMALFSGCGANGVSIAEADNGKQINLQSGDVMTLSLESNPTTGYSWQVLEIDDQILTQDGDPEYKRATDTDNLVGAGGAETFRFKGVRAGSTRLELGYMRPWESVPPVETFSVEVIVQ
ncbi:MAG: protease inhibitor I42 family protein [Anaerolineales bacterium]|jgi:inhibitor of cysteine peptidase